jgi:hypothetical protein
MNISMVPNIWCHLACPGNPHQLCGGNGTLASLYIAGIKNKRNSSLNLKVMSLKLKYFG